MLRIVRAALCILFLAPPFWAEAQDPPQTPPGEVVTEDKPPSPVVTAEESVIVTATRTNTRLQDQPVRVEVIDREEIEEKMLMTPGDIVMMLNEMGGMRVQATSPSLGAASEYPTSTDPATAPGPRTRAPTATTPATAPAM